MSIYHMSMSNVSRAHGSSSCATLSYISGKPVREERTAQTYSYGRAERVVCTGTMIPDFAPAAFSDPAQLFNSIESFEQAENARTAKKICVALPREFDLQTSRQVIEDYIQRNFVAKGYCATYAIHYDKDGNNPHCHILIPNRQIAKDGSWNAKRKMTYALDDRGNRIPQIDPKTGQQKVDARGRKAWKRINSVANPLDDRQTLKDLRAAWAEVCNERLQPADRIDHRSYADQGKEQIPTVHEGYAARAIAAAGGISDRIELNEQIRQANADLMKIAAERQTVYANLIILEKEQQAEQKKEAEARQRQEEAARAAARAAEEKSQQEGADALEKIKRLFNPDYDKQEEERQRQEAAARAAARAAEAQRQQEQRRQAARERDNAEAERQREDAAYEQHWKNQLQDLDWRQFEYFCKNEYQDRLRAARADAAEIWIKQHIDTDIKDYFTGRVAAEKKKIDTWKRKNPEPPAPEPRAPLHKRIFGYTYTRSDGYKFKDKDYYIYKDSQQNLIDQWQCDFSKVRQPLDQAEKELQYCNDHQYTSIRALAEQDRYSSKPHHDGLRSMIEGGARKLIETLTEFAPIRAMIKIVNYFAHDRAEERRKDLAQEREQQHQRSQGRGGYYR